jgi:hypothetical protein
VVSVIRGLRQDQIITTNLPHQEGTTVDIEMMADSEITTTITRTAEVASDQEAVASVEETAVAADSDPAAEAVVSEVVDNFIQINNYSKNNVKKIFSHNEYFCSIFCAGSGCFCD